jgi:hypothetical protein
VLLWGTKDGKADRECKAKFILRGLVNTMKYAVVEVTWPDIQNQMEAWNAHNSLLVRRSSEFERVT